MKTVLHSFAIGGSMTWSSQTQGEWMQTWEGNSLQEGVVCHLCYARLQWYLGWNCKTSNLEYRLGSWSGVWDMVGCTTPKNFPGDPPNQQSPRSDLLLAHRRLLTQMDLSIWLRMLDLGQSEKYGMWEMGGGCTTYFLIWGWRWLNQKRL